MSINKTRAKQIIREEIERVDEAFGRSGRGGRYGGYGTTGYRGGGYYNDPLYSRAGSGRMSDAEARERGGRGYDEPYEPDIPAGPRGGIVHSTVTIYTDPSQASDKFNANLGQRLDDAANVFITMTGYDGMAGNLITGVDPVTRYNRPGDRWVLSKSADGGYTFKVGAVIGTGDKPSEALADAAQQGFEGSEVVLSALGMARDEFYAGDTGEHERTPGGEALVHAMEPEDMDEMDEVVIDGSSTFEEDDVVIDGSTTYERDDLNEATRRVVGRWNKLAGTLKG